MSKAPTLAQFTSEIRSRNISKADLFYVEIVAPKLISRGSQTASIWCNMAQTPQSSILTNDNFIENGVRRKYAYDQDYQNLVLEFYVDQGYDIKKFFDQWKNLTVNTHRSFGYPVDYTVDKLNVFSLDRTGAPTYCHEYINAFPKTVNAMELSYATGSPIAKFSVEFVYEDAKSVGYLDGVDSRETTKNKKILIPDNLSDDILSKNIPNAYFYTALNTLDSTSANSGAMLENFTTFESIFDELINMQIPNHNY